MAAFTTGAIPAMTGMALFGTVVAVVAELAVPGPFTADDAVDPAPVKPGSNDVVAVECGVELEQAAARATTAAATLATRMDRR